MRKATYVYGVCRKQSCVSGPSGFSPAWLEGRGPPETSRRGALGFLRGRRAARCGLPRGGCRQRLVFPPTGQLVSDQLRSGTWGWKVGAGPGAPLIRIRGVPTPSSVNRGAVALTRWFSKCRLGTLEILSGDPRGENNNNSRLNH